MTATTVILFEENDQQNSAHNQKGAQRIERRNGERFDDSQHVAIINPRRRLICELMDLSHAGAKVRIMEGAVPPVGEPLALTLFDGTSVPAHVTWVGPRALGLTFVKELSEVDTHLLSETLGRGFYGKAVRLQRLTAE